MASRGKSRKKNILGTGTRARVQDRKEVGLFNNRDEVSGHGVLSFWELSTTALDGAVPLWERQGSRAQEERSVMSKTGTSFIWTGRKKEGCILTQVSHNSRFGPRKLKEMASLFSGSVHLLIGKGEMGVAMAQFKRAPLKMRRERERERELKKQRVWGST